MGPISGETEAAPSGWTVDTLHWQMQARFNDLNRLLDERYETQVKALAEAVLSQQTAMRTALAAAESAVDIASTASEKAVEKADKSAEKRFDSVNEFRAQLTDQAATFMPRSESEVRITGLTERFDAAIARNAERIRATELVIQTMPSATEHSSLKNSNDIAHTALAERVTILDRSVTERITILDRSVTERFALDQGHSAGAKDQIGDYRSNRAGFSQMTGMVIGFVGLIVTIIVSAIAVYTAVK